MDRLDGHRLDARSSAVTSRRRLWLLLGLGLQGLDGLTFAVFYWVADQSVYFERNPVVVNLYAIGGIALVLGAKWLLIAYCAWYGDRALRWGRLGGFWAVTVALIVVGAIGAGSNIRALVLSL